MAGPALHRFEHDGTRYVVDPETCFCFECDDVSWAVLEHYPQTPVNRVLHLLEGDYPKKELEEVIGELEWLRACKSILPEPTYEELQKQFEIERGLRHITVELSPPPGKNATVRKGWLGAGKAKPEKRSIAYPIAQEAADLLLARSEGQRDLCLELVLRDGLDDIAPLTALCIRARRMACLAGKNLSVAVRVRALRLPRIPKALAGHLLSAKLELSAEAGVAASLSRFLRAGSKDLDGLSKALASGEAGIGGAIVLQPRRPEFSDAVQYLDKAGFRTIEIDLDGAFAAVPGLNPSDMLEGFHSTAVYYAKRLLQHHYFRLDPIAPLFWRIYNGTPLRRADPAGTNELAVDAEGRIYPSRYLLGRDDLQVGALAEATLDEAALAGFDEVGALTTPACLRCWARNLCGGGTAAVHHALTGSLRKPAEAWCDAQRRWLEAAVAAFSLLSSQGVNFTRVYQDLDRTAKPSLLVLARAAFRMSIGVRPIEEADAEMLTRWENWNEAAYFVCNESGILMATRYDREMDSLHPRAYENELVLTRKNGTPFGLLKVRPDRYPGTAHAWIYMRDEADYTSESIRTSFRTLLREMGNQHELHRLTVPAGPAEDALAAFLQAVAFRCEGIQREALYLHGRYHDVRTFGITLDRR